MTMITRRTGLALMAALLAACAPKTAEKRYSFKGEIKALDPASKSATIDAGPIGDWMEAMTMAYPVQPDSAFQKLHIGDRIEATMVVASNTKYYVTDVTVAPK
jgi:Cu/Ag efflux protein CusF